MPDPQVVHTLRRKASDIETAIASYEKKLAQARRDLSAINASLRLL